MQVITPADARGEQADFDRLVLTCVLEKALGERDRCGGSLAGRVGLGGTALGVLLMLYVPGHPVLAPDDYRSANECDEQAWVRELLELNLTQERAVSRWMAAIVARRAMEASHLWEDLGLPDRSVLSSLMLSHFAPLAALNEGGQMRWKRFFYRQLCEQEGVSHCTSPTCSNCPDVPRCFAPDSAEAAIARSKQAPV